MPDGRRTRPARESHEVQTTPDIDPDADPDVDPGINPGVDKTGELRAEIEAAGYYPDDVAEGVAAAVVGERVLDFVVHHEPTFDRDEVRRHMTVVTLGPTRLVVVHTDEHAADDLLPSSYTSTTSETIPLSAVTSVVVTRMVAEPEAYTPEPSQPDASVSEALVTIGWGAVGRIDLEPASCSDPNCDADHGYTGTMTSDDFSLRVSSAADGTEAVTRLLAFADELSHATIGR